MPTKQMQRLLAQQAALRGQQQYYRQKVGYKPVQMQVEQPSNNLTAMPPSMQMLKTKPMGGK